MGEQYPANPGSDSGSGDTDQLAVLQHLCEASGVSFDLTHAQQYLRIAAREISPTQSRAARLRLAHAASLMGLQVSVQNYSVREAIQYVSHEAPLAIFTISREGSARWFILAEADGQKGKLADLGHGDLQGWHRAEEIAKSLGINNPDTVVEWLAGQPAKPMEGATSSHTEPESHAVAGHAGEHAHHHVHHMPPVQRLFKLLRPESADLWLVVLFAVAVGALSLTTPIVAMAVVNTVALGTLLQQLVVLCVALGVALSLAGVLTFLQNVIVEFIQRRVFVRVAADLAYRLPRVDLHAFDRQHGPELVNRFFAVLTVQKAAATLLLDGITLFLQICIGLLLLAFYHTYLLGFDLFLIASFAFLFFVLGRGAVRTSLKESTSKFRVAGWMEEIARHPIAFKTAGGPRFAMEKTDLLTREYLLARRDHFRVLMRQIGFALFLQVVANVILLGLGGSLVIRGDLTLGELVAAEIVVTLVVASFAKLGKQLEAYYDLLAAVDKLGYLLDLELEEEGQEHHHPRTGGAAVALHHVSFTYDGQHSPAVNDLSLQLRPGERVTITGRNGAGKSTLADLLFGLRHPNHGWVEIDGADIRTMRLDSLREHVALVKGIEVIEGSVADNVRMGRDHISQVDVRTALQRVGLLETILALPDGLDTMLWTGGAPLSLGQANRLMVARAIVGQPRLLILDEALDHMDADIRDTVLPAILGPDARWTLVVISHSQEVAAICDRVFELSPKAE